MGGVPVLLMIAAMGITYGWQPDTRGGVEYIIQIPPDQLSEIERVGEISSVIDPAVRGHVSRVVIQVGNGPVPRRTPTNFASRPGPQLNGAVIAASDQSPVPIPEMDDTRQAAPIRSLDPVLISETAPTAVMKPDANDLSGPGYSFPTTPSSLRNTASGAIDQAGREFGARASEQVNNVLGQAGNTLRNQTSGFQASGAAGGSAFGGSALGANNRIQPPQNSNLSLPPQAPSFTGSDPNGELARTRPGGPNTDPTNSRDNTWRGFPTTPTGRATTDPVDSNTAAANNPFDPRALNAQAGSANAPSNRQSANGLSPSDTFGKLPGGLSFPGAGNSPTAGYTQANATRGLNSPTATLQGANAQIPNAPSGVYSQYEQTQRDLQTRNSNSGVNSVYGRTQYDPSTRDPAPAGNYGQGSSYSPTGTAGYNNQSPGYGAREQQVAQTRMGPDSKLTREQIEAGAWSIDIYNRPIDRDGKLVQLTNQTAGVYGSNPRQQNDRYTDMTYSSLGQPNVNPPRMAETSTSNPQPRASFEYNRPLPASTRPISENGQLTRGPLPRGATTSEMTRRPVAAGEPQYDPPSLTSRRNASTLEGSSVTSGGIERPRQVAAQPLFNGLLLISFVANIYLIFWLKNLRLQFRDMVAAKRITNSGSQTA